MLLQPAHRRSILLFDRVDRHQLAALGDVRTPSIADLFVAVLSNQSDIPRSSGAATPLSRANLIGIEPLFNALHKKKRVGARL
jgi:hypothetical protein